ncbi:MAG TPA: type II secretion system F family protein [Burkholderiales bacterium]|nr:type II secretion system F family protein [Burkholderiales bacterium]
MVKRAPRSYLQIQLSERWPFMVHMIASGEASGRLAEMLDRTATQSTREIERRIAAFVALRAPLLILAMAAIVLALLLPIFELNQIVR